VLLTAAITALAWTCASPPAHAAEGGRASQPTLVFGTGYAQVGGSDAVRRVQARLRRLGHRPGPIDGLFGPLTRAAVERFQAARGLQIDGVVGPQTNARLLPQRPRHRVDRPAGRSPASQVHRAAPERPGAAPEAPPAAPQTQAARPAHPVGAAPLPSTEPDSSSSLSPLLLAAAAGFLVLGGWMLVRRRLRQEPRRKRSPSAEGPALNVGLLCAAVLAGFVIGAAAGALFATQAGPDGTPDATAKPLVSHQGGR
jgi:hypothetical protein